jgi:succinoglycan biosynthesis transport protein ExoP
MTAPRSSRNPTGAPPQGLLAGGGLSDEDFDGGGGDGAGLDIARYLAALRRYAWIVVALIIVAVTAAVLYTRQVPRVYEAQASVQIEPRIQDLVGQGGVVGGNTSGGSIEYYRQQLQILRSDSLIRKTVESRDFHLQLLSEKERASRTTEEQVQLAARRLGQQLTISYPQQNRTLYVKVKSTKPELAAELADAHIATFEVYSRGQLSTDTEKAAAALATEFADAERKLGEADAALYTFLKDKNLLSETLEARQSMVTSNIASFGQRVAEARAKRIELGARLARMKSLSDQDVLESPLLALAGNSSFDGLRAQYYTERNNFLELEKELGPKTVEYAKAKAKVDDLHAALVAESKRALAAVQEEYKTAAATEGALASEMEGYQREAVALGPSIVEYNRLARAKKSAEDRYNTAVGGLQNSQMSDRLGRKLDSNVEPLDHARVPTVPVSPKLGVNIAIGAVGGLFLGVSLVFLLVFLDRSIKTAEDAQQLVGAPVLGMIPALADGELPSDDDKARDLYVHQHPTSRVAECCRALRTNILFSGADRQLKTLVVSSANPREGKTTSVIYLGTTLAQSGQRVLLIDTDMRRPRLHASTGVPRGKGLSNLILGDESYDEAIKTTEIPNLFVLPCGPLPPNPAELLVSKRFGAVLDELRTRFDRIILDSPPLEPVTDAVVLSRQADGVLLVVRAGKTERDEARRSAKKIRDVGGEIVGVVLNEADVDRRSGYYYKYYGYGENLGDAKA